MELRDVKEAVKLHKKGRTYAEIGSMMGINEVVISREVNKYQKQQEVKTT